MDFFKEKYDCIIVGGSIASLACAITLQENGIDTLILERHNLPGGVATSFVRGGYEFEASLHEMMSIGEKDNPRELLKFLLDHDINIEWLRVPEAFKLVSRKDNINITIPFGIENVINKINEYVPDSKESLELFFNWCKKVNDSNNATKNKPINPKEMLQNHFELVGTGAYSVKEMLDYCKVPLQAQKILSAYWYYLGSPIEMLPFAPYAVLLTEYLEYGAYIPKGTSYELARKLEQKAISLGCQIEYNQEVENIIIKDKHHVSSVLLKSGRLIHADYIVSNAYPQTTYSKLLTPQSLVPKKALKMYTSKQESVSCLSLLLTLDKPPSFFNFDVYSTFISKNEMNSMEQFKSLYTKDSFDYTTLIIMNYANPYIIDEDKTYLSITTLPFGITFEDIDINNYHNLKDEITKRFISIINLEYNTKVEDHILELELITPITIAHYTSQYKGSIYGHLYRMDDNSVARVMMKNKEQFYDNLFFVGAHTNSGDGMTPVIYSGISAALDIIKKVGNK